MVENNAFALKYRNIRLTVERHAIAGATVFKVGFSDGRLPLVLTRALNPDNESWWTSIPEGRLPEAREIGQLIEEYILANS